LPTNYENPPALDLLEDAQRDRRDGVDFVDKPASAPEAAASAKAEPEPA
jgi:hypothetical protein